MSTKSLEMLGHAIAPGENAFIELEIAKLHTHTPLKVPVIIHRGKEEGPTLLLMSGVHGDEVNGVAIVREIIRQKLNVPQKGTVICLPVLNVFGYLNQSRFFPDGRDLNRVFPGSENGSLASQFAYYFRKEIAPLADYIIDFHTGGAMRDNMPQIRCVFDDQTIVDLAKVFNAPFIIHSKYIHNSIRETFKHLNKPILLFEGGRTEHIDGQVIDVGIEGTINVMQHLGMITKGGVENRKPMVLIDKSKWIRAPYSGMFNLLVKNGEYVKKGTPLGRISDPFGEFDKLVKASDTGYIFCINQAPVVYKGNALFHISLKAEIAH